MDDDAGLGENHAPSEAPYFTDIFESEVRTMAGISALSPRLEVSGEDFGLQTRAGNPAIYLVSAPGPNAIREPAYCRQDVQFFRRVSGTISNSYALQVNGTFHCHGSLGLSGPSPFDVEQVRRIATRNNLRQWCEIITSYVDEDYGGTPHGRPAGSAGWWRDCPRIRVKAFLYTDPQGGRKTEVALRVIPGVSPFRSMALASGKLAADDIGEYASGFPMEKIIFDCHDPHAFSSVGKPGVFEKLAQQFQELPEQVQANIKLDVEDDFAVVTLPISGHKTVRIAYSDDQTDQIRAVFLYDERAGQSHDVTRALPQDGRDLTLRRIYESLRCGESTAECPPPFHDTQRHASGRSNASSEEITPETELRRDTNGKFRTE